MDRTILSRILELVSGPDKIIYQTILGLLGIFVVFFIWKWLQFHRARVTVDELTDGLKNVLKRNHFSEAIALCDNTPGPVARVLLSALSVYPDKDNSQTDIKKVLNNIHDVTQRQIDVEVSLLESWMLICPAFAVIAPLLGWVNLVVFCLDYLNKTQKETETFAQIGTWLDAFQENAISWTGPLLIGVGLSILCTLASFYFQKRIRDYCREMESATKEIMIFTKKHFCVEGENTDIEIRTVTANSDLKPMGPWHLIFALLFLLLISSLLFNVNKKESEQVQVKGILVTEVDPKVTIVSKKLLIEVVAPNDYVYQNEHYNRSKLETKIADMKDEEIYFLIKCELKSQDFIDVIDIARRLRKKTFIIVKTQEIPLSTGNVPGQESAK